MNFFVEGALRDPASANKPSTMPIGDAYRIGNIPGMDVHWGLAAGIVLAIVLLGADEPHDLRLRRPHRPAAIRAPRRRRACRSAG